MPTSGGRCCASSTSDSSSRQEDRTETCRFQAEVDVEIVDDPTAKAAILARQLSHFEPSDSRRVTPGVDVESDRRLMPAIRGLRLTIIGVNAKFKYGGNKTVEHRADIAAALQIRNAPMDAAPRRRLMSRPAAPMGM